MKKEYIMALSAVACWGTVATASKLMMNEKSAMYVMAWSFLFASIFLTGWNIVTGKLAGIKKTDIKTLLQMVGVGSLGVLFYNLFILLGISRLNAQVAFVINYLWPALIIVFSCIILRERMNIGKVAAVLCSIAGIVVVTTNGDLAGFRPDSVSGMLFCVGAALCYGLYSVLSKLMTYDTGIAMLMAYGSGTIVSFVWIAFTGEMDLPHGPVLWGTLFNGVICNALPYLLWVFAISMSRSTAIIANLAYLTPFVSLIVTHLVLKEEITVFSVLGLILIVAGIGIQFLADRIFSGKTQAEG